MPLYCETGQMLGLLHEPLNTVTNAAGLIAVFFIYRLLRKHGAPWFIYPFLALMLASVLGSFFWHGTRSGIALSFDTLPGIAALCFFTFVWASELWNRWRGYAFVTVFVLAVAIAAFLPIPFMFRFFIPVILLSLFLIGISFRRDKKAGWFGVGMLCVLLLSAGFRTIDLAACPYLPIGTHFLWHLLNPLGIYLAVLVLVHLRLNKETRRSLPGAA